MSYSGLGIVRSLGRRGIPVFAVDAARDRLGMQSRFSTPVIAPPLEPTPEPYLDALVELGRCFGEPAVLYPTGDRTVLLFSERRQQLAPYYSFVMPAHDLIRRLVTKDGLYELAREHGIEGPRTAFPEDLESARRLAAELKYPVLIKPVLSPSWCRPELTKVVGPGAKVCVARDAEELVALYRRIAPLDPGMVFQELVPGDDDQLYYVCLYLDRSGRALAGFAGRKLRVHPVHFGSATLARSCHDPELLEVARRTAQSFGYRGLCGIEFKKDARDGRYKLIELNARFGLWDALGARLGVDLAAIAYRDALGLPVAAAWPRVRAQTWVGAGRDFAAVRAYRQEGVAASWLGWATTVATADMHAVLALDDPLPFLSAAYRYGRERLGRGLGRRRPAAAGPALTKPVAPTGPAPALIRAVKAVPGVAALARSEPYRRLRHWLTRRFAPREHLTFTQFLRVPLQYEALTGPVLDYLRPRLGGRPLRVVVLGCSNGAEAYTVASVLHAAGVEHEIRAYDIEPAMVERARAATYTAAEVHDNPRVTEEFVAATFDRVGDRYVVKPAIARRARFGVADVLAPALVPLVGTADVVLAQNLLFHLRRADAAVALRHLEAILARPGAAFLDGADLDVRERATQELGLEPLAWRIEEVHEQARAGRGSFYPYAYYGLEPLRTNVRDWQRRYATVFLRPLPLAAAPRIVAHAG